MYVRNVAGYNFAFYYRDAVIHIPFDGRIYSIPDDSGTYRELRVIQPMHIRTQSVTYINKDGSTASANLSGHKRRGRPPKTVDSDKPLKGVKPKPKSAEESIAEDRTTVNETDTTKELVDTTINDVSVSIVDIDLEHEALIEETQKDEPKAEEPKAEEPPKKKRGRPRKVVDENAKPAPKKKRGRPRKTQK